MSRTGHGGGDRGALLVICPWFIQFFSSSFGFIAVSIEDAVIG